MTQFDKSPAFYTQRTHILFQLIPCDAMLKDNLILLIKSLHVRIYPNPILPK